LRKAGFRPAFLNFQVPTPDPQLPIDTQVQDQIKS
jgi:hypothetical protein